jgi:TolB-like protein/DNA-binding winged helix-turn-helix (wHTH) protein
MKEPSGANGPIRFAAFEADVSCGELRKHGLRIKLPDQSFQVLAMLLERPRQIVTREEFHKKLWPGDTFVDFDHGLNNAMNRLREALGDTAESPRFVETLPRRGYRFVANVDGAVFPEASRPTTSASPAEQRALPRTAEKAAAQPPTFIGAQRPMARIWLPLSALAVGLAALLLLNPGRLRQRVFGRAAPARIQSIAVLPLENLSGDPAQEYFADGMTEELTTNLGKIAGLRVISRTSAMHYKGTRKTLPEIARELKVDAVMEGGVARSGNRVRITTQLVEASSDRHLWAESYERDLRDTLALQDEIARDVANQVRIKLSPQEQIQLAKAHPVDPEAQEEYLKGRYELNKWTAEGAKKSIEYFQRAVQKDPAYSQAWAGLADAYLFLARHGIWPKGPTLQEAKAATLKALELDETLSEGHVSLSMLMIELEHSWSAAEAELLRAIALNPNNATAHIVHGYQLGARGRFDEAIAEMKRARELDPLSGNSQNALGAAFYWAGRYDEALQQFRESPDPDVNSGIRHQRMAAIYERKGMQKEAIAELLTALRLTGKTEVAASVERKYLSSGYAEAKKTFLWGDLRETQRRAKNGYPGPHASEIAALYAQLGEKDRALEWLDKAFRDGEILVYLKVDDHFEALRSDPRFQELLRRLGLPS